MTTNKVKISYGKVAERLGLGPDVDGSTLLTALDEVKAEAAEIRADTVAGGNKPAPPVATAELPAEPVTAGITPPPGLALVDKGTFDGVRDQMSELDRFRSEVAARVGCTTDADAPTVLAAIDEALTEITTTAEGTETIDTIELAELRADAELHRSAEQRTVVDNAVRDGRLRPFEREKWVSLLQESPAAAKALVGLPQQVPVGPPVGYTGGIDDIGESQPDDVLGRLFGDDRRH